MNNPTGIRYGIWDLSPGVTPGHFKALLAASYFAIGIMTLVGNLQPYLFSTMFQLSSAEQGKLSGDLGSYNELVFIVIAGFLGAASDKLGRRRIFAGGFLVMALAYVLYPLAPDRGTLIAYRMIFAVGAAAVSSMLATVLADYAIEKSRGKLVGIAFFCNGIGIASLIGLGTALPKIIQASGASPEQTTRCAYWSVAALCLSPMLIVAFGLKPGVPAQLQKREPLLTTARIGLAAARDPRVALGYLSALVSRGDLAIISTFFLLWLTRVGVERGVDTATAFKHAGIFFVVAQVAATFWAALAITLLDKFNRVAMLAFGMVLAAGSYLLVGFIDDPLGPGMYLASALLGVGEMSGVLTSQSLIGQAASERGRGAVIGVYSAFGSLGILLATGVGGSLYASWRPSAPFIVVGAADAILAVIALGVYLATRRSARALATGSLVALKSLEPH